MSKLGLGTVQFGTDYGINSDPGIVSKSEVKRILDFAKSKGINILDTAPAYGRSEKKLGLNDLSDFNLITKTRHFQGSEIIDGDINALRNDITLTLKNLKKNNLYALLVHSADDLMKPGAEKIYQTLRQLKREGKILKLGVSVYDPVQVESIVNRFDMDIVQLPLNILDKRMLDSGMIELLEKKNIEIHSRSVFLQGLLLTKYNERNEKFDRWKDLWKLWNEWLEDNKISALQATIRYVLGIEYISKVLVGVDSTEQLKEIIQASSGKLPELPCEFKTEDTDLLNPSNWQRL